MHDCVTQNWREGNIFCELMLVCSVIFFVYLLISKVKAQYCLLTGMYVLHYFMHVHQTRECMCNSKPEFVGSRDHSVTYFMCVL